MRLIGNKKQYHYLERVRKHRLKLGVLLIVALALVGYGAYGFWQRYQATSSQPAVKVDEVVTHSTDKPAETIVKDCEDFKTAANNPKKITIPSVGVDGCIQRVGIDQNKAIAVPTNVNVAGWYVNSPVPGEKGVSIIDGHVQGRYSSAIFGKIKDLKAGDTINIMLGNGTDRSFEVVSVKSYSVEETNKQQFVQLEGVERQLTLITCGGRFDPKSQSYDQRVVVRAKYKP